MAPWESNAVSVFLLLPTPTFIPSRWSSDCSRLNTSTVVAQAETHFTHRVAHRELVLRHGPNFSLCLVPQVLSHPPTRYTPL